MDNVQNPPSVFDFHTLPDKTKLQRYYVGRSLHEINGPAAIVDAAVIKRNCRRMLDTAEKLGFGFRAHVKTHKTIEVAREQVGEKHGPVKIVVSTVAEAEHMLPFLRQCKSQGRDVNILYGVPPSVSCVSRLQQIQGMLGPESVSFLIDHHEQLQNLSRGSIENAHPILVFIKIDTGYHRAGALPQSTQLLDLMNSILRSLRPVKVVGFYSHLGSSYASGNPKESLEYLIKEIEEASKAAERAKTLGLGENRVTISVGATPSASSARLFLQDSPSIQRLRKMVNGLQQHYDIEIHAGVYPFLDLQQLATHTLNGNVDKDVSVSMDDIGIRILAEVLSTYTERDQQEVLVGAGSLALGREPAKSYAGWGIVAPTPWARGTLQSTYDWTGSSGWKVGRISQEHGILTWEGSENALAALTIGQNVLIWPNHACIAGAGFEWYLVVDSDDGNGGTKVQDVWVRCRGW